MILAFLNLGVVYMGSWKDSSLVVTAAISSAAAIAFTVAIYEQSLIPTRLAALNNELVEQKKGAETESKEAAKIRQAYSELQTATKSNDAVSEEKQRVLQSTVESLRLKMAEVKMTDAFQYNNPYPSGFGSLRVGDSATKVFDVYGASRVESQEDGYYSVGGADGDLVSFVTYYFKEDDESKTITHISVNLPFSGKVSDGFLQATLEEKLGQPHKLPKPGYYVWDLDGGQHIYKNDALSYLVMAKGLIPGAWPDKIRATLRSR
jgi:hypothetical protein